jgi:hypothetical protein
LFIHSFIPARHAIDLIAEIPPIPSEDRIIACDGGGGALGHPKVTVIRNGEGEREGGDREEGKEGRERVIDGGALGHPKVDLSSCSHKEMGREVRERGRERGMGWVEIWKVVSRAKPNLCESCGWPSLDRPDGLSNNGRPQDVIITTYETNFYSSQNYPIRNDCDPDR